MTAETNIYDATDQVSLQGIIYTTENEGKRRKTLTGNCKLNTRPT